jgi:hypothetical protein
MEKKISELARMVLERRRQGKCVGCGAEMVAGEPFQETRVSYKGERWIELRCRQCSDDLAWAFWPEDYGPFPHQRHNPGRC